MHTHLTDAGEDPAHRFGLHGAQGLTDAELLSFLLTRGGPPGRRALELARRILLEIGGLARLQRAPSAALERVPGVGPSNARRLQALGALLTRSVDRPIPRGAVVNEPRQVYEALRGECRRSAVEHFWVLALDSRGRRVLMREVARGGANRVHLAPREVFAAAVAEAASTVILAHNHPSGDPTPSPEDLALTEELAHIGELLGIPIRDHVIVGDGRFVSLAELGHLPLDPPGFARPGAAQR